MPVEITLPSAPGQTFGPGFQIVGNAGQGPLPNDRFWQLRLISGIVGSETTIDVGLASRNFFVNEIAFGQVGAEYPVAGNPEFAQGTPGRIQMRLVDTVGQVHDQGEESVVWDWTSGQHLLTTKAIQRTATGGFTAADRAILEAIEAATQMTVPGVGLLQLVNLIANLPPSFHGRELITPDRTGDGTLTRPGGALAVNASGIYWEIVSKAPGIGIDEGAPDVTEIRALELRFVLQLGDGTQYTDEHRQYAEGNTAWFWGSRTPARLDYSITPGVSVRFWWLLVGAGAWLPGSVPLELFLPRPTLLPRP